MQVMEMEEKVMDITVEGPREKLRQIVEKNGEAVLQDSDRVEGLLRDHCGTYRKEISALVGALNERVPLELRGSWQTAMTPEAMRARLVQRMEDNRGLAPEVAEWAVDTWSYALGIGLTRSSDRLRSEVLGGVGQRSLVPAENIVIGEHSVSRAEAERRAAIASDRPGGAALAAGAAGAAIVGTGLLATAQQKKKAGVGAGILLGLAALGAIAYSNHKPTPPPPTPVVVVPPAPATATAPKPTAVAHVATSIAAGTPLQIRMNQAISSDDVNVGETFTATLAAPLFLNGKVVVPVGADATIRVLSIDPGGKITGQTQMQLALVSLASNGKNFKVSAAAYSVLGPKQAAVAAERTGIGAGVGAVGGFIAGKLLHHGKAGTAIGTGSGGTIGFATSKPQPAKVSPEQMLHFRLNKPMPVNA